MKYLKYYLLALSIIILDQVVKLAVYYKMEMGLVGEIPIFGDWFKLHYTLNPGMAFGLEFGSIYGKLALSLFRLVAVFGIGYYLFVMAKRQVHSGFLWCFALILGGAIGNLVDSIFYGVLLGNAPYAESNPIFYPWFYGQVIDMFYFDIWEGQLPEWLPFVGGQHTSLWPIFNIADAAIFAAVTTILIFQKRFFPEEQTSKTEAEEPKSNTQDSSSLEIS